MSLAKPAVKSLIFAEFQLGEVSVVRICNSNVSRNMAGDVYAAHPELAVTLGALNGELPTSGPTIQVQRSKLDFVRQVTKDRAYYPQVKVRIRELVIEHGSNTGDLIAHAEGPIISHRTKDGITTFNIAGAMQALESDSGYSATKECNAEFGDQHSCTAPVESLKQTGTITAHVDGTELTITGVAAVPLYYWMPGKLRKAGEEVSIHYYREGNTFYTTQRIPQTWQDDLDNAINVVVDVLPGCRRNPSDCVLLNPNPWQFKGFGITTPDRNPILEVLDE